ncbi:MAG: hypothetical protein HZA90_14110 [Verrucomicrobia bacterium]|nr:hypothetical protein [Verrucomicrobiota bacterium]
MLLRIKLVVLLAPLAAGVLVAGTPGRTGGLTDLPKEILAPVSLANPGFEEEGTGWTPASAEAFSTASAVGAAHSGKSCLRFDAAQTTRFVPSWRQKLPDVGPGAYVLRFWLKTRSVGTQGKAGDGVRVGLEFQRQDDQRAWPATEVFRGTRDWHQQELRVFIPNDLKPGTACLTIHRYGGPGGGEAFFDDFSLERVASSAIEAFLEYPNFRGLLPDDGPMRLRVWVKVNAVQPRSPAQIEVVNEADRKQVARVELPAGAKEQVVHIDAASWPLGSYLLRARLGDAAYPAYRICKISAAQRRQMATWFDEHGVWHQQGKPAFVLGFYNAQGWDSTGRLDQLAAARPNFAIDYASWALPLEEQRRYLAQLRQWGVWFLSTVNMVFPGSAYNVLRHPIGKELLPAASEAEDTPENLDRYLVRLAEAMRATPGHAGWYVMDERPFDQAPRHFHQYQVLREADPDHPTFGVSDKPDELAFWRDTLDVVGLDPYPLFNAKQGRPLTLAGDWTRAAVEATHGSRPVWMVLQFFQGWSTDRWPTEEELRSMSLMAITEGARGLFYWSFGIRGLKAVRNETEQAEYWRRAVAVCRELKRLEPALVAPDSAGLVHTVSDPRIRWQARKVAGKAVVFAYLPAKRFSERFEQPPAEVRFTFQDGRTVARKFAPDTADWFEIELASRPEDTERKKTRD